jgi:hypothetical protein
MTIGSLTTQGLEFECGGGPPRHLRARQCHRRHPRIGGLRRMTATLNAASRQWASRPDDQRFLTLEDLVASVGARRELSRASDVRLDSLALSHDADGDSLPTCPNGQHIAFTNWSFGQLASLVGAPASYLRKLPAPLARLNLEWGLEGSDDGREQPSCCTSLRLNQPPMARCARSPRPRTGASGTST